MSDLKKRLLEKIEKEQVKPTPKIYFITKNIIIWLTVLIFLVLGMIATMLIFYIADNLELLLIILEAPKMLPKIIFIGLPSVWILLSLIFAFIAGTSLHNTKKGYKYSVLWILLIIFILQILGGLVLSKTNFSTYIEKKIHQRMFMNDLQHRKEKLWRSPEYGFLGGVIKEMSKKEEWIVLCFKGEKWTLKLNNETQFPQHFNFELDQKIMVKGKIIDAKNHIFEAEQITPFMDLRRKMMFKKRNFGGGLPPIKPPPRLPF